MSENTEILLSFAIGLFLAIIVAKVFSLKTKGIIRVVANALAGAAFLLGLRLLHLLIVPINPLSALVIGFLGLPGLILMILLAIFI